MSATNYLEFLTSLERLAPRLTDLVAVSNSKWAVVIESKSGLFALNRLFRIAPGVGQRLKLCALPHTASVRPSGMLPLSQIQGLKSRCKLAATHFWFSWFFGVAFSMRRLRHITVG
jgi:hypothetical protein